jgi:hypothetical protein
MLFGRRKFYIIFSAWTVLVLVLPCGRSGLGLYNIHYRGAWTWTTINSSFVSMILRPCAPLVIHFDVIDL